VVVTVIVSADEKLLTASNRVLKAMVLNFT
jgi:hypothetical protein